MSGPLTVQKGDAAGMTQLHEQIERLGADSLALRERVAAWRDALHAAPELSGKEENTIAFVEGELQRMGIPSRRVEHGGLIATLTGRPGPRRLLLRADMDALPVAESRCNLSGEKAAVSTAEGVSHACGHDAHTAMLLGALELLAARRQEWSGEILAVFERGEETGFGVVPLLRTLTEEYDGIDGCFALHVYADLPEGAISLQPGWRMSGAVSYDVTLQGAGGHASRPDYCRNPIDCFVSIYQDLAAFRMRATNPNDCLTYAVGLVQAGASSNIIPDSLRFAGTARFLDAGRCGLPFREALQQIVAGACGIYGCTASYNRLSGAIPGVWNDPDCAALAEKTAAALYGPQFVQRTAPWMASESLSIYNSLYSGVLGMLGIADGKRFGAPHHSPQFDLDSSLLYRGSGCTAAYALAFMDEGFTPPPRRDAKGELARLIQQIK